MIEGGYVPALEADARALLAPRSTAGEDTCSGKALAGRRVLVKEPRRIVSIWASLAWMFEGEPVA